MAGRNSAGRLLNTGGGSLKKVGYVRWWKTISKAMTKISAYFWSLLSSMVGFNSITESLIIPRIVSGVYTSKSSLIVNLSIRWLSTWESYCALVARFCLDTTNLIRLFPSDMKSTVSLMLSKIFALLYFILHLKHPQTQPCCVLKGWSTKLFPRWLQRWDAILK